MNNRERRSTSIARLKSAESELILTQAKKQLNLVRNLLAEKDTLRKEILFVLAKSLIEDLFFIFGNESTLKSVLAVEVAEGQFITEEGIFGKDNSEVSELKPDQILTMERQDQILGLK